MFDLADFNDPSTFVGRVCPNCGRIDLVGDALGNSQVPLEDLNFSNCRACGFGYDDARNS